MIIFTLCSNNYLPMARVLGRSVLLNNPGYTFIIGLVDRFDPSIDYSAFAPLEIIPVESIGIAQLNDMILRYSIVELNTAVKPFYFQYLFNNFAASLATKICYLDPDIRVYSSLAPIERALDVASVLLTPHLLSPVFSDGGPFGEHIYLNYGLYNLGFCGMRWSSSTEKTLSWWGNHLIDQCLDNVENGLFVDQLWMNFAPVFFQEVDISRGVGMNVAYWNLQERRLSRVNKTWYVNDQTELMFYHFSSFQCDVPNSLGKYCTRFTMSDRPEMKSLFDEYRAELVEYDFHRFKKIPCAYIVQRTEHLYRRKLDYYRSHPLRLLVDYRKRPLALLKALAKVKSRSR